VPGQPGLHRETLSRKTKKKKVVICSPENALAGPHPHTNTERNKLMNGKKNFLVK
jgi:hypothetical protein